MENFCLLDGAMVYDTVRALKPFKDPATPWIAALSSHEDMRLAGPILMAFQRVAEGTDEWDELAALTGAYPHCLHMSVMASELSLEALAGHLRQFAFFRDSSGDNYGLRIADCRVLAYLLDVLTPGQWDALTAPLAQWVIRDRRGGKAPLRLEETRLQRTGDAQQLHLGDDQIERLMQAGEPDALLEQIGRSPDIAAAQYTQSRYEAACNCIRLWTASGSTNRAVLARLIDLVFFHGTKLRDDAAHMQRLLQQAIAAAR
jgi:alkanesulfonate monooxygenase SsuD/methylene tetrahydromethanopterin reductase-like flavin-dependent oxidoreductase (luciferase family)